MESHQLGFFFDDFVEGAEITHALSKTIFERWYDSLFKAHDIEDGHASCITASLGTGKTNY